MQVHLGDLDLDLELNEGLLTISVNGTERGSLRLIDPEPVTIEEPEQEVEPTTPDEPEVFPEGWYRAEDGSLMMSGFWNEETETWEGGTPVNTAEQG